MREKPTCIKKTGAPVYHGTAAYMSQQKEDYKETLTTFLEVRKLQAHI
jgi:hypothetical protein